MGYSTCGRHGARTCDKCDRCPTCDGLKRLRIIKCPVNWCGPYRLCQDCAPSARTWDHDSCKQGSARAATERAAREAAEAAGHPVVRAGVNLPSGRVFAWTTRGNFEVEAATYRAAVERADSVLDITGDVLGGALGFGWDLMIAFPPCTYLCSSGLHWNTRRPGRAQKTAEALDFVRALLDAPIHRIALENPIGCISTQIRPPDQIIQPHEFGHDASKRTCLWLKNLPSLVATARVEPRIVNGRPRWGNQTDSGQNKLTPSDDRWKKRSATYEGIAAAMADQWG